MKKQISKTTSSSTILLIDDIRNHCKIDIDDDDALLEIYKNAAITLIEKECDLDIFVTVYDEIFCSPKRQYFLTGANCTAINSLKYYDDTNTLITVDPSNYVTYIPFERRPILTMKQDYILPTTYNRPDAVIINYSTGAATMPDLLKAAALLQIGTFYEQRENENEVKLSQLDFGVQRIINIYKTVLH